jgi:hypothetical protein
MNPLRKYLAGGALVASTLIGGAVGAAFLGTAGAQTSTTQPGAAATAQVPDGSGRHTGGPHQANGITETPLTGSDLTKATAAANAAVPGSTIDRVETDADGDTYEVHMTKSDGSRVTVKLDANFVVTKTVSGKG